MLRFDADFSLKLEEKQQVPLKKETNTAPQQHPEKIACPKCKKGTVLKGKTGYGCSQYTTGCDFVFTFDAIKKTANGAPLTKELVLKIISK